MLWLTCSKYDIYTYWEINKVSVNGSVHFRDGLFYVIIFK